MVKELLTKFRRMSKRKRRSEAGTSEREEAVDKPLTFDTIDYMARTDHQVAAVLLSIELPILGAEWVVQPAPGGGKQADEIAMTMNRWLVAEIHNGWSAFLRDCLTFLKYGHAVFEQVWMNEDDKWKIYKLALRPVRTLHDPMYDDVGNLKSIKQHAVKSNYSYIDVTLPREKLLILTLSGKGASDWKGQSALYPAHKAWKLKDTMERISTIAHERWSAGIPVLKVPEGVGFNSTEWSAGEKTLQDLHASEKSWMILPEDWEVDLLDRKVGASTPILFIRYLDDAIARSMLATHLNIGGAQGVSSAIGGVLAEMFLHAIQAFADEIASRITHDVIIPNVIMNWGEQKDGYPYLTARNIHAAALQRIGYLVQSGAIRVTESLERFLYNVIGADYDPSKIIDTGRGPGGTARPSPMKDGKDGSDGSDGTDGGSGTGHSFNSGGI